MTPNRVRMSKFPFYGLTCVRRCNRKKLDGLGIKMRIYILAIPVVEFLSVGYKITKFERFLPKNQHTQIDVVKKLSITKKVLRN